MRNIRNNSAGARRRSSYGPVIFAVVTVAALSLLLTFIIIGRGSDDLGHIDGYEACINEAAKSPTLGITYDRNTCVLPSGLAFPRE